ncbi:MAG: class I SAM-dependent methyltransferase [Roseibium sp.]|uniref:class I SAM-dependent methyltransferase n=1 Tax=Roseibium sp. TaxID=1936156 RepID=UPI00262E49A9|nr:class I SAM-dependent methyltransferase [Roseibium sp.]MCV0425739.1 class I SAM-dependent methyltransferase [Roseibium sp.]
MSGFSSEWLALREPLDLAARNGRVETAFLDQLPSGSVRILDLASGAGSTVAAFGTRLPQETDWLLTDFDPVLLDLAVKRRDIATNFNMSVHHADLAKDLEKLPFEKVDAVTTSAFLDLVSEPFLERLADRVVQAGRPFLASLTYDGRADFTPGDDHDEDLKSALNSHQKTDKGFGMSLGPDAAAFAIELFEARGYKVVQGTSDWMISPSAKAFLSEFLSGWLRVGREVGISSDTLDAWWRQRHEQIEAGLLSMTVGHVDFAAYPQ